ncbi:hypothetical protein HELRODRAFT_82533, partial [Helobdella robusta]|uniref:JmjC domain-containing protein n=1 Tax=Helobdella robusta TaxID=6412 RepID=T1G4T3_HELRO
VSKLIVHEGGCNVERLDSLSQEDFIENYAYKKPFIVKNSNDNTKFRKFSRRQTMLEQFGDKIVRLSTANTYSYGKKDVALKEYIEKILKPQGLQDRGNETFYWFGDNNHTEWSEVFAAYHPPPLHIPKMSPAFSYGLAGAGTGVPFHFHGPGFSEVIYGSKRWFLYPFEMTPEFDPNSTTLHWVVEKMPFLPDGMLPLDCTIKPGEALYFPDRWWHATLNVNTSVFISTFLG